ncbi:hypothetical protein [Aquirufa sp. A-Brett2-W8]
MNKILATILFLSFNNLAHSQIKNLNEIEFNHPEFENNFNNYIEKGYPDSTIYSINIFVFNVDEKGIVNHITHAGNLDSTGLKFVIDRIKRSEPYWIKSSPSATNKWFILPFIAGDPRIDGKQPSLEEINRLVTIILFEINNRMIPSVDNVRLLHTRQSLYGNQVIM